MRSKDVENLFSLCSQSFSRLFVVYYDLVNPLDSFGRTMLANLKLRGISLPGLLECPAEKDHEERLRRNGIEKASVLNMTDYMGKFLSKEERNRIFHLEFIDELEEFNLLQSHACVAYGCNFNPEVELGFASNK